MTHRSARLPARLVLVVTALALLLSLVPGAAVAAPPPATGYLYGGMYTGDFYNHGAVLTQAGDWAGRRMTFAGTFQDMREDPPATEHLLEQGWSAQATPFVNLQVEASSARIAGGEFDAYIARFRSSVQAWLNKGGGRSLIIAPLQEMNGSWTTWGCDPGNFKAAYRRIVAEFRGAGVDETQVRWAYAPNGWSDPACPGRLVDYYPGHDVVDLIGISAYNYGPKGYYGWEGPDRVFGPYLNELRGFAPDKPYVIAQTGVAPVGGDRDAWVRDAWAYLAADPNVVGIVYFNIDKSAAGGNEYDWRIWFGSHGTTGFRQAMSATHTAHAWPLRAWFRPGTLTVGPVSRVAGPSRVETAIALSRSAFAGAGEVVLAPQSSYAHALLGAPLAGTLGGPVLLSPQHELDQRVLDEIRRLGAGHVTLVGGVADLSPAVEERLRSAGLSTERMDGANVFDLSRRIAERVGGSEAYVVEGANPDPRRGWPDAISVSALATYQRRPILFVERDRLPDETRQAIRDLQLQHATIVGGPVAVSDQTAEAIRQEGPTVDRVYGAARYDTARAVADLAMAAGMVAGRTWLATGENYPDALTAGPVVAQDRGVLLLVHGQIMEGSPITRAWLREQRFERVRLVGGVAAITPHIEGEAYGVVAG